MACVIPRPGEAIPGPGRRLPPGNPATPGDGVDEQANCSPRLARAGRRTLVGGRSTAGAFRSRFGFVALCLPCSLGHARFLPGPRPEVPDLQRAVAIPDEPVDIPRTSVGKPELHGFAVQGASRLREDPASLAFLHRKRELRDGGRRDLRARQLCQPASVRLPGDAPALLLRGRSVQRDLVPDGTWRPVHRRVQLWLPRANLQRWRCGSGNRRRERHLRFLWRRQHSGVFSTDRG